MFISCVYVTLKLGVMKQIIAYPVLVLFCVNSLKECAYSALSFLVKPQVLNGNSLL